MPKKKTHQFGLLAEKIAMIFLKLKGYRILEHRYKTLVGEIDIIAKKSHQIIFVEVKARKVRAVIEELIHPNQIKRISRAAEIFIAKNPQFHDYDWRFDFIEVRRFFLLKHYRNFVS